MNVVDLPGTVTNEHSKKLIKSAFVSVRQCSPKGCYVSLTAKTRVQSPVGSASYLNGLEDQARFLSRLFGEFLGNKHVYFPGLEDASPCADGPLSLQQNRNVLANLNPPIEPQSEFRGGGCPPVISFARSLAPSMWEAAGPGVRAQPCQGRGRGFESLRPLQQYQPLSMKARPAILAG